jgi:hypothetical protein
MTIKKAPIIKENIPSNLPESAPADLSEIYKIVKEQQEMINNLKEQLSLKPETIKEDLVKVTCLYDGIKLTLKASGLKGDNIDFFKFGDSRKLRREIVENIVRYNRSFAEKGFFIVEDNDMIRDLGLTEYYENFIGLDVLNKLNTITVDRLISTYNKANDNFKRLILDKFIVGNVDGIDGYIDFKKIDALSKASGIDVQNSINEAKRARPNN